MLHVHAIKSHSSSFPMEPLNQIIEESHRHKKSSLKKRKDDLKQLIERNMKLDEPILPLNLTWVETGTNNTNIIQFR